MVETQEEKDAKQSLDAQRNSGFLASIQSKMPGFANSTLGKLILAFIITATPLNDQNGPETAPPQDKQKVTAKSDPTETKQEKEQEPEKQDPAKVKAEPPVEKPKPAEAAPKTLTDEFNRALDKAIDNKLAEIRDAQPKDALKAEIAKMMGVDIDGISERIKGAVTGELNGLKEMKVTDKQVTDALRDALDPSSRPTPEVEPEIKRVEFRVKAGDKDAFRTFEGFSGGFPSFDQLKDQFKAIIYAHQADNASPIETMDALKKSISENTVLPEKIRDKMAEIIDKSGIDPNKYAYYMEKEKAFFIENTPKTEVPASKPETKTGEPEEKPKEEPKKVGAVLRDVFEENACPQGPKEQPDQALAQETVQPNITRGMGLG